LDLFGIHFSRHFELIYKDNHNEIRYETTQNNENIQD